MNESASRLTVFFEDPFWVGIFERYDGGKLSACRVVFGAEPSDADVYEFVLQSYRELEFSPGVKAERKRAEKNPKRIRRSASAEIASHGTGTRSQQALQLQYEQKKLERKVKSREEKLMEEERKFALRQRKKKEKHRGR